MASSGSINLSFYYAVMWLYKFLILLCCVAALSIFCPVTALWFSLVTNKSGLDFLSVNKISVCLSGLHDQGK